MFRNSAQRDILFLDRSVLIDLNINPITLSTPHGSLRVDMSMLAVVLLLLSSTRAYKVLDFSETAVNSNNYRLRVDWEADKLEKIKLLHEDGETMASCPFRQSDSVCFVVLHKHGQWRLESSDVKVAHSWYRMFCHWSHIFCK